VLAAGALYNYNNNDDDDDNNNNNNNNNGLDFTVVYSDVYKIVCGIHTMNVEYCKCRHVMHL
jgi:hypothetical protein